MPPFDPQLPASHDIRAQIAGIPLENIANIAKQAFDKTTIIPLWFGEGDLPTPAFIGEAALAGIDMLEHAAVPLSCAKQLNHFGDLLIVFGIKDSDHGSGVKRW